jgi:hypothetical protein
MRTRGADSLGAAVQQVAERAKTLTRLEAELATIELRRKAAEVGAGAALATAAVVIALFAVGFFFAGIAAGLATFMPTWLVSVLRRGSPPVPEQAIEEAQLTAAALRGNGRG